MDMFRHHLQRLKLLEKSLGFQNEIQWNACSMILLYHFVGIYWCYYYTFPVRWQTILFAAFMYIATGFGQTGGVHHYWTHRSFKANYPLQIILLLCSSSAGHNSVIQWVLDHTLHHKYSDTDADPHNATRGIFFSQIGWLMMKKNKQVRLKSKEIDLSDVTNDPLLKFQHKYFTTFKIIFCYLIPVMTGVLLWNEDWKCAVAWQCFIRYLGILHAGSSVNSISHTYGKRPYNNKILATQNSFASLLTFGEGWHNYHHTFPFDYKTTETTGMLDVTTGIINFFVMIGWAYDLKEASPEMIDSVTKKNHDGNFHCTENVKL